MGAARYPGYEPLRAEGDRIRESETIRNRRLGPVVVHGCVIGNYARRIEIEDCFFKDVRAIKCNLLATVFRRCEFDTVRSDFLMSYTEVFLECRFKGTISGVNFGIRLDSYVPADLLESHRIHNEQLRSTAAFGIDVREAILANVGFRGEEIIGEVLFAEGQCLIYEADELDARLKRLREPLKNSPIFGALCGGDNPETRRELVSMESFGLTERIDEVEALLKTEKIQVSRTPQLRSGAK